MNDEFTSQSCPECGADGFNPEISKIISAFPSDDEHVCKCCGAEE